MKKIILYISSLIVFAVIFFFIKKTITPNQLSKRTDSILENHSTIYGEVEVLNGCGDIGIANLYSNFLMHEGFDVIESKNADSFDYLNTTIIVHNESKMDVAQKLAKTLKIKNIKLNGNGIWDLSIIIGKNYKILDSFEIIKKHFSPF